MTTTNLTAAARHAIALARAIEAESKGMSATTQNKRWREVFAAEDALRGRAMFA